MTSPWMTAKEAAGYVRKTPRAFDVWVTRYGVRPDGSTGRIRLYSAAHLDRAVKALAQRPTAQHRLVRSA